MSNVLNKHKQFTHNNKTRHNKERLWWKKSLITTERKSSKRTIATLLASTDFLCLHFDRLSCPMRSWEVVTARHAGLLCKVNTKKLCECLLEERWTGNSHASGVRSYLHGSSHYKWLQQKTITAILKNLATDHTLPRYHSSGKQGRSEWNPKTVSRLKYAEQIHVKMFLNYLQIWASTILCFNTVGDQNIQNMDA